MRQKCLRFPFSPPPSCASDKRERLAAPEAATDFVKEMSRFVTPSLAKRLLTGPSSAAPWLKEASRMLDRVEPMLGAPSPTP